MVGNKFQVGVLNTGDLCYPYMVSILIASSLVAKQPGVTSFKLIYPFVPLSCYCIRGLLLIRPLTLSTDLPLLISVDTKKETNGLKSSSLECFVLLLIID